MKLIHDMSKRQVKQKKSKKQKKVMVNPETRMVQNGSLTPPDRNFSPKRIIFRRFRQISAVSNQNFTLANGHDQFLVVTNSATGNAVPYVDSWRIKYIDFWVICEGVFTTTLTVSAIGTDLSSNMNNDPETAYTVSARTPMEPKHMRVVPAKNRPLGSWHFTSTLNAGGALFAVNIVSGSATARYCTMDICFEAVLNDSGNPLGYNINTSTVTLGAIGGRPCLSGMVPEGINNLG